MFSFKKEYIEYLKVIIQLIQEWFITEIQYYFNITLPVVCESNNTMDYLIFVKDYMLHSSYKIWYGIPFEDNYTESLDELEIISIDVSMWSVVFV
jgi:hypothetical protein